MYASQLSTLDHIQVSSHFKENIHQFLKCLTQRPQKPQERHEYPHLIDNIKVCQAD